VAGRYFPRGLEIGAGIRVSAAPWSGASAAGGRSTARSGRHLPAGASARPVGAVGFHRHGRSRTSVDRRDRHSRARNTPMSSVPWSGWWRSLMIVLARLNSLGPRRRTRCRQTTRSRSALPPPRAHPSNILDVTVPMAPLHLYDELNTVQLPSWLVQQEHQSWRRRWHRVASRLVTAARRQAGLGPARRPGH
jgi:hypothetical protein